MSNSFIISADELKLAQQKMLKMLLCFKQFCEENNLLFYLHGGAAIGAIREHGFVPWDDDIDILMPRPDYELFCKLWNNSSYSEQYCFCKTDKNINYHHPCASIRDPSTTFICSYNQHLDICHGIALEIGPMDAVADSKIKHFKQLFYAFVFNLFNTQRLPNNKGGIIRAVSWISYKLVPFNSIRYKIWTYAEKQMSKYSWKECDYVAELRGSIRFIFKKYPKEWFDKAAYFDFEGYSIPVMAGYDGYLKGIFGDYMKRPPESDQIAKHDIVFCDMTHPYTDYLNKYYFPGTKKQNGAM